MPYETVVRYVQQRTAKQVVSPLRAVPPCYISRPEIEIDPMIINNDCYSSDSDDYNACYSSDSDDYNAILVMPMTGRK